MRSVYAEENNFSHHESGCACGACCGESHADAGHDQIRNTARAGAGSVDADGAQGKALIAGPKWDTNELTFAFPDNPSLYDTDDTPGIQYGSGEPVQGFASLNSNQQRAAEAAFEQYAAISGLTFRKLDADQGAEATLRLAQSTSPSTAWGYFPSDRPEGGDAWFGLSNGYYASPEIGTYAWHTVMHEIGHALGLSHGHDGKAALSRTDDTMEHSIMTYRSYVGDDLSGGYANERYGYAQTLMQSDIEAIQTLYGANFDYNSGDTTYRWDTKTGEMYVDGVGSGTPGANRVFSTLWDGGGRDTLDLRDYKGGVSVNLQPGAASILSDEQRALLNQAERGEPIYASGNVWMSRLYNGDTRSLIEDVRAGRGNDMLIGNSGENKLTGGAGHDTLGGGKGDDELYGNAGNDILRGARDEDSIKGGVGNDQVRGGRDGDWLNGGGGDDFLFGARGDDTLVGGRGDDQIRGGSGADVFVFRSDGGRDIVHDFQDGVDMIRLVGLKGSLDGVDIEAFDGGVKLAYGASEIVLVGMSENMIDNSDFIL